MKTKFINSIKLKKKKNQKDIKITKKRKNRGINP